MINVKAFIASLKLFWMRKLLFTDRGLHNFIPNLDLNKARTCGIEYIKKIRTSLKNKF